MIYVKRIQDDTAWCGPDISQGHLTVSDVPCVLPRCAKVVKPFVVTHREARFCKEYCMRVDVLGLYLDLSQRMYS